MESIITYLIEEFQNIIYPKLKDNFIDWIIKCEKFSPDSKRLLICISIDVKFDLIPKQEYANLFNTLKYDPFGPPQLIFEDAVNNNNASLYRVASAKGNKNVRYSALIKLESFAEFYLEEKFEDEDLFMLIKSLKNGDYEELYLEGINGKPPRNICWVAEYEEVDKILNKANNDRVNPTEALCDKLGIFWEYMGTVRDPHPMFVRLDYPEEINENFSQPTAMSGDWKSREGLFLSFIKLDDFGRTRPLISIDLKDSLREKIHHKIDRKYKYSVKFVGQALSAKRDLSSIIDDGINRFKQKK